MNIKELTYSRTAKINTGNYENKDVTIGVVVTPTEDETIEELMIVARAWVNNRIKSEIQNIREK